MKIYPFCEGHQGLVVAEAAGKVPTGRGHSGVDVFFR